MNLSSSGGSSASNAAPATPAAPTQSSNPSVNPASVLSTTDAPKLPPARQTNLTGDVSLDFDREDFGEDTPVVEAPKPEAKQPEQPGEETPAETPAEKDPFDFETPELKDELKKLEKKPEEKKVEEKEQTPQPKPAEVKQEGRKYTGDGELDKVLRGLRNNDFNAYKDQLAQWKKAYDERGAQPKYLAAHPEAFKLTPAYQQAEQGYNMAQFEYNAAVQAKRDLLEKKPVSILDGYDKKTGQPVYKTFKPDDKGNYPADLVLYVDEDLKAVQDGLRQNEAHFKTFGETHKKLVVEERKFIDEGFKKVFKNLDEKTFNDTEKSYKDLVEKLIPDSYTPEDARKLAYYSMVSHLRLAALVNKVIGEKKATLAPAPRKGPAAAPGDSIPLDPDSMFTDND